MSGFKPSHSKSARSDYVTGVAGKSCFAPNSATSSVPSSCLSGQASQLVRKQSCLSKTCPSKSLRKKCTISSAGSDPSDRSDCIFLSLCLTNKTHGVRGNKNATRGTAYVVYESPADAKVAVEKLNGFSFGGRFLVVLMHQLDKVVKPEDLVTRQEELERVKKQYNVS